jgi:large subunit ribosomal protein L21
MYAVIDDRGRQYRVARGDRIDVDLLPAEKGSRIDFDKVLLIGGLSKGNLLGTPHVEGASIRARVLGEVKGPKLRVFKLRRRKNSRRRAGHRQHFTRIQIEDIVVPG